MYIFFDIDGVLNTSSQWQKLFSLNEECIKNFCEMVKQTGGEPVMVSSWRTGFIATRHEDNEEPVRRLETLFAQYGVEIKDKTPKLIGRPREKEIERFLYYHPAKEYVIIDDDRAEYIQVTEHNYFVDAKCGFSKADIAGVKKRVL